MKRLTIVVAAILLTLPAVTGCGGNPAALETAPVEGRVTLDGEPVSQGIVRFNPDRGRAGKGAIQADGTFTISTYAPGDGAVVGRHRVAIVAQQSDGTQAFVEDVAEVEWLVPPQYANPSTSGLEFTVQADQPNYAEFSLTSDADR